MGSHLSTYPKNCALELLTGHMTAREFGDDGIRFREPHRLALRSMGTIEQQGNIDRSNFVDPKTLDQTLAIACRCYDLDYDDESEHLNPRAIHEWPSSLPHPS